jgi:membrane-bound inhibitor of C-type lysozyme
MKPNPAFLAPVLLASMCSAVGNAQVIDSGRYTSQSVVYGCAGGTRLPVTYLNLKEGESFAVIYMRGRTHLLRSQITASGTSYVSVDEQAGWRWRTKGDTGTLAHLAADHTATERMVRRNCKALPNAVR